jgi:hypothetical protein
VQIGRKCCLYSFTIDAIDTMGGICHFVQQSMNARAEPNNEVYPTVSTSGV